ncbi:MAG TPA: hypothetical protein VL793_02040 [Patescibacteria group bacterium]|jgi:hypothetical protein|nr:hypothetical protein [Patescibacteria group bacterium]
MNIWVRLGISVAILAVFAIVVTEVFKRHPELHERKKVIAGALAGAGTLMWLVAKVHGNNSEEAPNPDRIFTMRFCGSILAACAGIVTNISPIQHVVNSAKVLHTTARERPKVLAEETPAPVRPGQPPVKADFPKNARLQGIIFNPKSPSAIINGKTVFVGDRVGHARVASIERASVTLQIEDQKLVLAVR